MPRRPTDEQFATASEWLRVNEGDNGEAAACHAVADWIDAQSDKHELDKSIRQIARDKGVPAKVVRAILHKRAAAT